MEISLITIQNIFSDSNLLVGVIVLCYGGFTWLFKKHIENDYARKLVELKQCIQYEYSEKLESYKTELNSKIEVIRHDNNVSHLRTSLFFDHQRSAFADLIMKMAEVNDEWWRCYDPDDGEFRVPVPKNGKKQFEKLLNTHQLFLDDECNIPLSMVCNAYSRSLPFINSSDPESEEIQPDSYDVARYVDYLQPRIASIFRSKIGITENDNCLLEVVILQAMELFNKLHIAKDYIPSKLRTTNKTPSELVFIGVTHINELEHTLCSLDEYLDQDTRWLQYHIQIKQTLRVLKKENKKLTN